MNKQQKTITNWAFSYTGFDPYQAPELRQQCLIGTAELDGEVKPVLTSAILGKRDGKVVTRNTVYELLDIDPEYEKLYPNAKQRFLDTAIEV